jgi:hypothetical protein
LMRTLSRSSGFTGGFTDDIAGEFISV